MQNKNIIISVIAGLLVAAGIIGWLIFGGERPVTIKGGNGVSAQINATLKNTVLQREQDGKLLWKFTVASVTNDKQKNTATLNGITGKLYRSDGSYVDISADKGSVQLNKNDFSLEGNVKAVLNTGGELYSDKITWIQKTDNITAKGHFKLVKSPWTAIADEAVTTSALKNVKLKGNAKVEKGGE